MFSKRVASMKYKYRLLNGKNIKREGNALYRLYKPGNGNRNKDSDSGHCQLLYFYSLSIRS